MPHSTEIVPAAFVPAWQRRGAASQYTTLFGGHLVISEALSTLMVGKAQLARLLGVPDRGGLVSMVLAPPKPTPPRQGPPERRYNRRGGRPGLNVDFKAVCDAVAKARNGSGETMTDVAERFGVSQGWICKWVYPELARRQLPASAASKGPNHA